MKKAVLLAVMIVTAPTLMRPVNALPGGFQASAPDSNGEQPTAPASDQQAVAPAEPAIAPVASSITESPTVPPADPAPASSPQLEDPSPTSTQVSSDTAAISPANEEAATNTQPAQDAETHSGLMALFGGSIVLLLIAAFAAVLLYMLPTIIARSRGHRNTLMIGFLNLFTGWTFLGWIGCLVWSVVNPVTNVQAQTPGKV